MTTWIAFLRGVNLGKRQLKMAELRELCESLGYSAVRTILASGNVRFETNAGGVRDQLERALEARFGFAIGVVLRTADEIERMVASNPFSALDPAADAKGFVLLADQALPPSSPISDAPGDWEVARSDPREIYLIGYRRPNGRYSKGFAQLDKQLPRGHLVTMRSWGTILKARQ